MVSFDVVWPRSGRLHQRVDFASGTIGCASVLQKTAAPIAGRPAANLITSLLDSNNDATTGRPEAQPLQAEASGVLVFGWSMILSANRHRHFRIVRDGEKRLCVS
jgi:hypothetical protein